MRSLPARAPIAALVLAAGASARLGQPKQLLRVGGESLLRRTCRLALESGCSPVIAVIGSGAGRMRQELRGLNVSPVANPSWPEGMGSSLRCGMDTLLALDPPPDAVLLLVCDQPRLSREHLRRLLDEHRSSHAPIVASEYAGRAGVPAVFASSFFPQLAASSGDRGARDLIRNAADQARTLPWPDGAADIDRPEDLGELAGA